ncbi:hypothetical protein niasHT_014507 [Heterodera trifolii]|uniref:BTB domain-containing protein n=1 Tax=Heterodera trifolii TaxID=157864 RepID=A0ABD2KZM7_9BILA
MDKLSDRMNRLLSTGVDADVHFLVGQGDEQELLPAHKPILRVASDVFDAMFRFDEEFPVLATPEHGKKTSQKEGNSPVEIPDVEVEAFTTMLSFIYTDELSGLNGHNAIDVLYAGSVVGNQTMSAKRHGMLSEKSAGIAWPGTVPNSISDHSETFFGIFCRKYSDAIYIDGFQWKIFAQIQSTSGTKYLGFFIQCNADDYGSDWSCTCSATLYVVPQNEENTHYNWGSKTIYQSFCSINGENCGFSEFMAIEKLIHPGAGWYNKAEDTVTLSAHLTTVEL